VHDEFELLRNRTGRSRIGFAVLLKSFQVEGRFPNERKEVPRAALEYVAARIEILPDLFSEYKFSCRSCERDRAQIRPFLGFRRVNAKDSKDLSEWQAREVLSVDHKQERPYRDGSILLRRRNSSAMSSATFIGMPAANPTAPATRLSPEAEKKA
jgi:hypothetical protein